MRTIITLVMITFVGCHAPAGGEEAIELIVEEIGPKEIACRLINRSPDIYFVTGRPGREPVPDTEYWSEEGWAIKYQGWCRHRVELVQIDPGEVSEFVVNVNPQRPVRICLDAQKALLQFSEDGKLDSFSLDTPARLIGRLSNQPLQRTSR